MRVYLEYLPLGAIPILEFAGEWHYIQENILPTNPLEPEPTSATETITPTSLIRTNSSTTVTNIHTRWEWNPARSWNRAAIPMLDFRLDQLREFFQNTPFPKEGDLYISIRASYEEEGHVGRWLILGAGLFPAGSIPQATDDYSWELVERFCTLRNVDPEPEHENLARAWRQMCANHAEFESEHLKREAAIARSVKLLTSHLTSEQLIELEQHRYFRMRGRDGRTYKISTRTHGNVWLLNPEGEEVMNFCIVLQDSTIPIYDQMLTQKLMLEFDPETFYRIANPTVVQPRDIL